MAQRPYTSVYDISKRGGSFHWDSPWIREQVHGEVAELEGILVSTPYGIIGRKLEVFTVFAAIEVTIGSGSRRVDRTD
jgi:hypothetical protein